MQKFRESVIIFLYTGLIKKSTPAITVKVQKVQAFLTTEDYGVSGNNII